MAESIQSKVKRSLESVADLYHRLVLLVGETGTGKTGVLQDVAEEFVTSVVNVNLVLSRELLELTTKQRSLRVPNILNQIAGKVQAPVVLDNIEVLFDKELKQDPLRLLQRISRSRTVLASWNGTFIGGKLMYAKPGHPEYRNYASVDVLVVGMDGTVTVDSAVK